MPIVNTTPSTTAFEMDYQITSGRKGRVISQRIAPTVGSAFAAVGSGLPPGCKVVWSYLKQQAGVAVTSGSLYTADGIGLAFWPTTATASITTPVTNSQSSPQAATGTSVVYTNGLLINFRSDTTTNPARKPPEQVLGGNVPAANTASVNALLAVIPIGTTSQGIDARTVTGANLFGTTTTPSTVTLGPIDALVYCEYFGDTIST